MEELGKLALKNFKLPHYYVQAPSQKNLKVIEDFENRFYANQNAPELYLKIRRPLIDYFRVTDYFCDGFDHKEPFSDSLYKKSRLFRR